MKPNPSLRSFFALSGSALLLVSQSHAAYLYWDTNSTTAGLGDTAGIWGTSTFLHSVTNPEARLLITGTLSTTAATTLLADTITFGTINLALSGGATTVTVSSTQNIGNITFGLAQTNAMTLTGGTINFAAAGTIYALAPGTTQTISSVISGAGTSLTKGGLGTLLLTGTNTYTGATIIGGGGTLTVGNGTTGSLNGTTGTALTFNNGGGTFNVAEAASSTQGMGALTFTTGHGTVTSTAASVSATQTLTFASLAPRTLGATGNFSLATNTTSADNKIVLTSTTNAPLDTGSNDPGYFFGGTEYARYDTTNGYFRAVAYGGTDANAPAPLSGTDLGVVTSITDVKLNGNVTAQTTGAVNTIHLNGNTLTLLDGSQILDVGGILSNGGSIASGALQGLTGGGEIVFNVTGGNLSAASTIQDSRLTKTGAGTLTLSGANTYTGITTINSGTLTVSGGSAIADTGAVVLANAAGATFKLDASETIGSLSGGGFSGGDVDVQGNTLTHADTTNQTFGGKFIGTGSGVITKQGTGTLSLSNVNTFPGTINLNAGTLSFTLGNSSTTTIQPLSSGGAINISGGATLSVVPTVQVALGQVTNNNPSQLTAPNGFEISNNINITSGSAIFRLSGNGNRPIYSGNVTGGTSGSQTLSVLTGIPSVSTGDGQEYLFSGVVQDGVGGTLELSVDFNSSQTTGTSQFVNFSGQNTFTGPITVANTRGLTGGGYFTIGGVRSSNSATTGVTAGSGSLGTTAPGTGNYSNTISLASGTILNYASSANQTLGGVISGNGQILKDGAGTLTLTGNNTYTGASSHVAFTTATTIRAGILSVGSLNSVVGGTASSNLGAPTTVANGTIAIGNTTTGAQLTYTGTGEITDRVIDLKGTTGGATINQSGASGLLKFTSNLTATGAGAKFLTLDGSTAGTGEISGAIVNNSGTNTTAVVKQGTGTWTLSGTSSYTGATFVQNGTLSINSIDNGASNSAIGAGTIFTLGSNSDNATLIYTGAGNSSNRNLRLGTPSTSPGTGGGSILNNGSGALTFTAATFNNAQTSIVNTRTLTLGGSYTANANEIQGIIQNNTAVTGFVNVAKIDGSTWKLSGINTYSGTTTVSAGTLELGSTGSIANSSSVTIAAGGTLDTDAQATYTIPGAQPVAFGINASGSGSSGKIAAAGLDITNAVVTYNITGTPDDPVYVLATYTSLTGAAFASVPAAPAGYTLQYAYEGNKIALVQSGGSTYASWIAGFPVGGFTALGDDADGDGSDNGVENFFGTNPSVFSGGLVAVNVSGSTFTFTHPQSGTLASDLTAVYQWSKDLATFNASGAADGGGTTVTLTPALNTPVVGTTTVTATVTGTATTKLFVNIKVTQ